MKNIFKTSYYTIVKYIRNPFCIAGFIIAPIIMSFILTGSVDYKFTSTAVKLQNAGSSIHNNIIDPNQEILNLNDKVTIVIILIFFFYCSILGSLSIISDIKNGINKRFKASPAGITEILLGKCLGNVCVVGFAAFVVILITKFAFNVNWTGNILIIAVALLLFISIGNNFGVIVTGVSKNIYICVLFTLAVNSSMTFPVMAWVFSPTKMPGFLNITLKMSFHNYALKTIVAAVMNDGTLMLNSILVLAASALILQVLSLVIGRKVLA